MVILKIISMLLALLLFVVIVGFFFVGFPLLVWFQWRPCKHCGHHMEFKGLKPDENNGRYLFHCPKCGAWEQIPKEEFFRQHEHEYNSNENQIWY